jgi:hypothetical protein
MKNMKGLIGIIPVPSGLPENRSQFDLSSRFKVIKKESSTKDENMNGKIQKEGAHCCGSGSEAKWYRDHKGYSDGLDLLI